MKTVKVLAAIVGVCVVASPVMAASLNSKDRARVARAAPRDRDDVRYCLLKGKEGRDKGTVIGAAGGAGGYGKRRVASSSIVMPNDHTSESYAYAPPRMRSGDI